jgi:hypothetical protein
LAHQLNADATRFVKSIWANSSSIELERTVAYLESLAGDSRETEDVNSLMTVVNCIYYISRVPIPERAAKALRVLLMEERRLYPRNGILFALVRLGDEIAEQELFDSISGNRDANAINRGLHLEYFKDTVAIERRVPPRDEHGDDWGQCLEGLVAHIEDTEPRMMATKRIDLLTIRTFLEARGHLGPFCAEHYLRIEQSILSPKISRLAGERLRQVVLEEWYRLRDVVIGLNSPVAHP